MMVPEQYDGLGLETLTYLVALEEIAAVDASTAVLMSVHNSLPTQMIMRWGSDDQKERYLRPLARVGGQDIPPQLMRDRVDLIFSWFETLPNSQTMKTPPSRDRTTRDQKGPSHFTTEYTSPKRNVHTELKMAMNDVIGAAPCSGGGTRSYEI